MSIRLSVQALLYNGDELSIGKAALALAMVANEFDDYLVELLQRKGCRAVVTRAGGQGGNLKDKILRNALSAAEKGGAVDENAQNRYAVISCVEKALAAFDGPISDISGAGIKIGIVRRELDLAIAMYGRVGIAGINVDKEAASLGIIYYGLSK